MGLLLRSIAPSATIMIFSLFIPARFYKEGGGGETTWQKNWDCGCDMGSQKHGVQTMMMSAWELLQTDSSVNQSSGLLFQNPNRCYQQIITGQHQLFLILAQKTVFHQSGLHASGFPFLHTQVLTSFTILEVIAFPCLSMAPSATMIMLSLVPLERVWFIEQHNKTPNNTFLYICCRKFRSRRQIEKKKNKYNIAELEWSSVVHLVHCGEKRKILLPQTVFHTSSPPSRPLGASPGSTPSLPHKPERSPRPGSWNQTHTNNPVYMNAGDDGRCFCRLIWDLL